MTENASSESNFKRTGEIWNLPTEDRTYTVLKVCEGLEQFYGKPRFGNPQNPIDDLVYIILSNKTSLPVARRVYAGLKRKYASWESLVDHPSLEIENHLRPAGLATVKSRQLRSALQKIRQDFGTCDLRQLRSMSEEAAQQYLTSLPGVSQKVAKCVMMYTLGASVLPVDSHIHRVARRLGWTERRRADQCHEELEALVPADRRYAFHVDCVAHGQATCRSKDPLCELCCVNQHCAYFNNEFS